ncbi:MAG: ZIP family metal transporter [Candidatus Bathyarchaeia archaeon]
MVGLGLEILWWVLGCTVAVSAASLVGVVTLAVNERLLGGVLFALVGFSAGALMGGAFLHLLPESLDASPVASVFQLVIAGFVAFFLLERILRWRHCHQEGCPVHPFTYLNLVGDGVHNFIDGLIIAVSFAASIPLGVASTVAILAHEVPQELGDFGVLVYGGLSQARALLYNLLSALTAVAGALLGYLLTHAVEGVVSSLLPVAAGGFLYISASDLVPELHKQPDAAKSVTAFTSFMTGIGFMWAAKLLLGG